MSKLAALLAFLSVFAGVAGAQEPPWWRDAVFYEVYVRSFYDSNGDGTGDLPGLIEKLDYLNDGDPATQEDLGVTAIWLMPICESPSKHGYDVVDYFTVERDYGTNEDFRRLMEEAHKRGIRVIMDLVLNHTSIEHPWFQNARRGPDNPFYEYYVWSSTLPTYRGPWGQQVWHQADNAYYYGVFWAGMPDLNYRSQVTLWQIKEVIRFWVKDMGVDGFRLDAVKHLIEDGQIQENTAATHDLMKRYYSYVKSQSPDAFSVGEIWSGTKDVVPYVGDQLDAAFEFDTARSFIAAAREESPQPARIAEGVAVSAYPDQRFATFLTNHDQNRTMSELNGNAQQARAAASLLLTGPGIPFLYYGEEIGQQGAKPDPNIRSPMQWKNAANAGFSMGYSPWQPPQEDYATVNVDTQTADPSSLLSHYRRLIHARSASPALRRGSWTEVKASDKAVYAVLRHVEDQAVLVAINLGGEAIADCTFGLESSPLKPGRARDLLNDQNLQAPSIGASGEFQGYVPAPVLEPYSTLLIELR